MEVVERHGTEDTVQASDEIQPGAESRIRGIVEHSFNDQDVRLLRRSEFAARAALGRGRPV